MISYFQIISDYNLRLSETLKKLEDAEKTFPEGDLKIKTEPQKDTYYVRRNENGKRTCRIVKPSDPALQTYVNKRFAKDALRVLRKNKKAAEDFLKAHSGEEYETLIEQYPREFQQTNANLEKSAFCRAEDWESEPYFANTFHREELIHETAKGVMVRSKSEAMISNILYNRGFCYRNECRLELPDGKYIYPDFTIYLPRDEKIVYWEHFGMMGDEEYAAAACNRIKRYVSAGIFPGVQLIITMESEGMPLSSVMVDQMIDYYLCGIFPDQRKKTKSDFLW